MTDYLITRNDDMRILLEESNFAFSILMQSGGTPNTDYADYTSSNFIKSFRHVMQKPDLSRAQLASMLRAADRMKNRPKHDDTWAMVMSTLITNGANSNSNDVIN